MLLCLDGRGVSAVAQAEHRGGDEQGLDAEGLPDPAAEQGDAGQLAEELGDAAVHLAHHDHLGEEVVENALVQTVGQAGDQNGQQEKAVSGALAEYFFDRISLIHTFPTFQEKLRSGEPLLRC